MDQVSRPMLIALAATLVLAAVWMVALRPKAPTADTAPIPSQVKVIPKAQAASKAADAANAATKAAAEAAGGDAAPAATTPAPAPTPAQAPTAPKAATPEAAAKPQPAPAPAAKLVKLSGQARVLAEMRADKVVVLLFATPRGEDDRAVVRAVRGLDRHRGRVAVHVVPVSRVGAYDAVTRGLTVAQSPTTLIIDRDRKARMIVGLTEPRELSQAVGDALAGR
jgi:type IV secretory pathway VirB10-like protein